MQLLLLFLWCGLVGPSLNSRPLAVGLRPAGSSRNWKTRELTAQRRSLRAILRTNFLPFFLSVLIIASTLTHKCISMRPSNPQQGPHGDRDSLGGCWDPPWPRPVALCCGQGGPLAGRRGVRLTGFPARCKCSDSPCDSGPISLADSGARHFSSPHPPTCR